MKSVFEFTLVLDGISRFTTATEDALFRAGCDDALPVVANRVAQLDFAREGDSLSNAIVSAVADVQKAKIGAKVIRVEIAPSTLPLKVKKSIRRPMTKLPTGNGRRRVRLTRDQVYAD